MPSSSLLSISLGAEAPFRNGIVWNNQTGFLYIRVILQSC
jgi:hypothetical protein